MGEAALKISENESVVAVMPIKGNTEEVELTKSISNIELEAEAIVINTDDDYRNAAEFGRKLKLASSEVIAFFKPMKEAANKAHKEVCDREKIMLKPLISAEGLLKRTMGDYALMKERERQTVENAARKAAQEEAERKLAEAIKAEEDGDTKAAALAMQDAQMTDSMSRNMTVVAEQPKAVGISQSKDWEITTIDSEQVPIMFNGMELRTVDEKAVIRLIRASKGKIQIPGVTYKETVKTAIRK